MNLNHALEVAIHAALAGGAVLRQGFGSSQKVLSTAGKDIKLQADRDAEEAVLDRLRMAGNTPILAEESGEHDIGSSDSLWVVDPLDGTANYARGIPVCCVSIGLIQRGEAALGVIYDFNRDELFFGIPGQCAVHSKSGRDAPLLVSDVERPEDAMITTGFPVYREFGDDDLRAAIAIIQRFRKVRLMGSAAMSMVWVAGGWMDAYVEDTIMLWDVAAGAAIVRAAGGHVHLTPTPNHKWGRTIRCAGTQPLLQHLMPA